MGRHERPDQADPPRTLIGTLRLILRLPVTFLLGLLGLLVVLAIAAVQAENRYGDLWGAVISSGVAPLAGSIVLRTRLGAHLRRRRDRQMEAGKIAR